MCLSVCVCGCVGVCVGVGVCGWVGVYACACGWVGGLVGCGCVCMCLCVYLCMSLRCSSLLTFAHIYSLSLPYCIIGLDYKQCVHKMRLLTLTTLAAETSQVSFPDLMLELDLPQDEVEALIIEGSVV